MVYTSKDKVRVVIVSGTLRIEGEMHVLAGSRLTDALNSKAKDFLVVTNASVFSLESGDLLYEPSYVAVNRDAISAVFQIG
ncbi:MAG: hypothetical protein FDZ70_02305 [Actinobacteria bacterium]|nr:MAG: hypothetical protein FDZ70_02305 [Actinomycetota bacterium]